MQPPAAILETALYAEDIDAAETFYRDVFGLEVVRKLAGQFVFLRCGTQMLLIFNPQAAKTATPGNPIPRHGADGQGHFCFYAKDKVEVDGWKARFEALAIPVEHYHHWPNDSYSVYIRDPAGNSVEVGEARMWGLE